MYDVRPSERHHTAKQSVRLHKDMKHVADFLHKFHGGSVTWCTASQFCSSSFYHRFRAILALVQRGVWEFCFVGCRDRVETEAKGRIKHISYKWRFIVGSMGRVFKSECWDVGSVLSNQRVAWNHTHKRAAKGVQLMTVVWRRPCS